MSIESPLKGQWTDAIPNPFLSLSNTHTLIHRDDMYMHHKRGGSGKLPFGTPLVLSFSVSSLNKFTLPALYTLNDKALFHFCKNLFGSWKVGSTLV